MSEVIAESAPATLAGNPVGTKLCERRRARPADRGDARGARRERRQPRSRTRSARRPSGPIIRATCAVSRSAAPPRTCWRSPPASLPGAASAPARRRRLTTRGFAELFRFGKAFGARPETLTGLSGLGDLILTCSSAQSRNFSLGVALGKGEKPARGAGRTEARRRRFHCLGRGRDGGRAKASRCRSRPRSPLFWTSARASKRRSRIC